MATAISENNQLGYGSYSFEAVSDFISGYGSYSFEAISDFCEGYGDYNATVISDEDQIGYCRVAEFIASDDLIGIGRYASIGYFPNMQNTDNNSVKECTDVEGSSVLRARVYLTCPASGYSIEIPQEDIFSVSLKHKAKSPIDWSLTLRNDEFKYNDPDSAYSDLLRKGDWSIRRKTRKYIKIVFSSECNGVEVDWSFPCLVVDTIQVDDQMNFTASGKDKITNILSRPIKTESFVAEEVFGRIPDTSYQTQHPELYPNYTEKYQYLCAQLYQQGTLYVNGSPHGTVNKGVITLNQKDVSYYDTLNNKYLFLDPVVQGICGISAKEIINKLLDENLSTDMKPFSRNLNFSDFTISRNFNVQKASAISKIDELLFVACAEWIILPTEDGNDLIFTARENPWKPKTSADFVIADSFVDKSSSSNGNAFVINTLEISVPGRQAKSRVFLDLSAQGEAVHAEALYREPNKYSLSFPSAVWSGTKGIGAGATDNLHGLALAKDANSIKWKYSDDKQSVTGCDFVVCQGESWGNTPDKPADAWIVVGISGNKYNGGVIDESLILTQGFKIRYVDTYHRDVLHYGTISGDSIENAYIPSKEQAKKIAMYLMFCLARIAQTVNISVPPNLNIRIGDTIGVDLKTRFITGLFIVKEINFVVSNMQENGIELVFTTEENFGN